MGRWVQLAKSYNGLPAARVASAGRVGWRWTSRLGPRVSPPDYDENVDGEHRSQGVQGMRPDRILDLRAKLIDEVVHGDPPAKPARATCPNMSLRHQRRSAFVPPDGRDRLQRVGGRSPQWRPCRDSHGTPHQGFLPRGAEPVAIDGGGAAAEISLPAPPIEAVLRACGALRKRVVFWRLSRATGSWDNSSPVGRLRLACAQSMRAASARYVRWTTARGGTDLSIERQSASVRRSISPPQVTASRQVQAACATRAGSTGARIALTERSSSAVNLMTAGAFVGAHWETT